MKKHTVNFIVLLFLSANVLILAAQESTEGKFKANDESLQQYQYPAWFRDAKFGIWAHWGHKLFPVRVTGMPGNYICRQEVPVKLVRTILI